MRYVCKNPPWGGTKPLSAHRLLTPPPFFFVKLKKIVEGEKNNLKS